MIDDNVTYLKDMNMDSEDEDYDSSLYEYSLYNEPITIALGKPKYDKIDKYKIIYLNIYLIIDGESVAKIGIFEVKSEDMINILDEEGDIDLSKGKIIIIVSEKYFKKILSRHKKEAVIKVEEKE